MSTVRYQQPGLVRGAPAGGVVLAYPSSVATTPSGTGVALAGRLLDRSDAEILAAQLATDPADTFLHAHFAALRAAGAVLESRGRAKVRGRGRNAWELVAEFVPELGDWARAFARSARVRAAIEAGDVGVVDAAAAEDALAAAEDFRDAVAALLAGAGAPADSRSGRRRPARAS